MSSESAVGMRRPGMTLDKQILKIGIARKILKQEVEIAEAPAVSIVPRAQGFATGLPPTMT